ncbi:MAG: aminotransferase class I/II-fold pyridoxal phosphate-dependent enzyme [Nitrospirales bacterium]
MAGFPIQYAERIRTLPPYLFAAIDDMKRKAIEGGMDIINLGIGDPDLPTPAPIIESLRRAAGDPKHHQYPSYEGMLSFRTAVADWYKRRFAVTLNPKSEVVTLIGSKEGIGHIPLAFIDPGDIVLVPSPGYPVYPVATSFAGGTSHIMPLTKENRFLPDLAAIPKDVAKKSKMMFLNSPNNPTSVVAGKDFFKKVVDFAREHQILVCHDAAYSEIYYDGQRPEAGITALQLDDSVTDGLRKIYQERRDVLVPGLKSLGLELDSPQAAFYVWIGVPKGYTSASFTAHLIEKAGIVTTPGNGFGDPGEGYIRMTVTTTKERLAEAVERMQKIGW